MEHVVIGSDGPGRSFSFPNKTQHLEYSGGPSPNKNGYAATYLGYSILATRMIRKFKARNYEVGRLSITEMGSGNRTHLCRLFS